MFDLETIIISAIVAVLSAVVGYAASKEDFNKAKFATTIILQLAATFGLTVTGLGGTYDTAAYSATITYFVQKLWNSAKKKEAS